jgi:hypothetical protein
MLSLYLTKAMVAAWGNSGAWDRRPGSGPGRGWDRACDKVKLVLTPGVDLIEDGEVMMLTSESDCTLLLS